MRFNPIDKHFIFINYQSPEKLTPMKLIKATYHSRNFLHSAFALVFWVAVLTSTFPAQILNLSPAAEKPQPVSTVENRNADVSNFDVNKDFRIEKMPVEAGAELITIFANLKGLRNSSLMTNEEVPLISILRDTFGDEKIENDRLRYVWMLSYTKPSFGQRLASFVPFLYKRTGNKTDVGKNPPPPIIDLSPSKKDIWDKIFWTAFKSLILSDFSIPIRSSALQNRENAGNYRKAAVARALAVLSLYESVEGETILSDGEMKDIQARLLLSDKFLGSLMQSENLERVYQNNLGKTRELRGSNWELLRQYSEAEGLYFEPIEMPDHTATHALVWVALSDLAVNKNKKFNSRFLNIKNPWKDSRLLNWKGYSQVRWFDEQNRAVEPETVGAKPKTMIPLALYGLDYPKIPTLLVDFRDKNNPKKREMSKRILDDLTKNVLSVSKFGSLPYFVGRYVYDFVTNRRGMDINQVSRFNSYAQLKLLLSLNASFEPEFRDDILERLESVSLNPLENDLEIEMKLARRQYENLVEYAKRPDGLPEQIEKDRREEMIDLKHGTGQRVLYRLGNIFSFGIYKHYEKDTPELRNALDFRRQLDYHERFLIETARVSAKPEIDSDAEAVKNSLRFMTERGDAASTKTANAVAKLFSITDDVEILSLALSGLYGINNPTAKKQLLEIYQNQNTASRWRDLSLFYLKLAVKTRQNISPNDALAISEISE